MSIFKANDVRGIYPEELHEENAGKIARAAAVVFKAKKMIVGRDGRNSSVSLHKAVVDALVKEGIEVLDIGLCSCPLFYFAVPHLDAGGGIMLTASHNPPNYNGLKITKENAVMVNKDSGLHEIEELSSGSFTDKKGGAVKTVDVTDAYIAHVVQFAHHMKPLKLVFDSSNGVGAVVAPKILEKLGITVIHINKEIDGNFPGHGPDPLKPHVIELLGKAVREHQAELGVVYDADADRVFFVDEKGDAVSNEDILCIMAQDVLTQQQGTAIVSEMRLGWGIKETVEKLGGKNVKCRVGRSFIGKCMKEHDAPIGGELSGHFYFRDNWYSDSAIIATIIVLNKLSSSEKKLSELVEKKYFGSGEINFKIEDKDTAIAQIEQMYPGGKVDKRDGVKIEFDDWWFIVRKSNTEPLLRLVAEAKSKELLDEKVKEISEYLQNLS